MTGVSRRGLLLGSLVVAAAPMACVTAPPETAVTPTGPATPSPTDYDYLGSIMFNADGSCTIVHSDGSDWRIVA